MPSDATRPRFVILVIDDSPDFRNLLREALTLEGYEVVDAADGQEGVRRFEEIAPDLVLLDMVMPDKDGIETLREILRRQFDAWVITLSGRPAASDYNEAAVLLGAKGAFLKPFRLQDLLVAIRAELGEDLSAAG